MGTAVMDQPTLASLVARFHRAPMPDATIMNRDELTAHR